jgi:hypothetical protein
MIGLDALFGDARPTSISYLYDIGVTLRRLTFNYNIIWQENVSIPNVKHIVGLRWDVIFTKLE